MGRLTSKQYILAALARHGFFFKKRLGQNFLIDGNIASMIVDAALVNGHSNAIEIGAGAGALSELLAEKLEKLILVEIDPFVVKMLVEEFQTYPNVSIVHGDFLKLDMVNVMRGMSESYAAVSNLPYYISTPILSKLAFAENPPERIVATMQKEVADRIAAKVGSKQYGAFSILLGNLYEAEVLFAISPNCFFPAPKVESTALALNRRPKPLAGDISKDELSKLVHGCFGMRRKTLANNLSASYSISKELASNILQKADISPSERAEKLEINDFARLHEAMRSELM
ncbi:MAG: 16S rRNA (adenine(1518)-N(6)/adenine(1519)-N(6))-dimethyltransferase RsmA [Eubacteriaceae bacterium]|nr:16S rRNA (adenine(1518)-N(6)/adenine(1519)-N(6))-dimethyltransferase RsmA [Eubacteriaceae bacterium]